MAANDGIIQTVGIGIDPTCESDWIAFQVSSGLWIISSEVVVQQPGFAQVILSRKSQVIDKRADSIGILIWRGRAEGIRTPAPDGPMSAVVVPRGTENDTPARIGRAPGSA